MYTEEISKFKEKIENKEPVSFENSNDALSVMEALAQINRKKGETHD